MGNGTTRVPVPGPVAGLVGFLAVAAAVGVGHLVGALINRPSSPFLAVSDDLLNIFTGVGPLRDFGIAVFGEYDGVALQVGVGIVLAVVGALSGLLSRRSALPGLVVIVLLGLVGLSAVYVEFDLSDVQPDPLAAGTVDAVASLVALVAGVVSFLLLRRVASRVPAAPPAPAAAVSRRGVLGSVAGVAGVAMFSGVAGEFLVRRGGRVAASQRAIGRITPDEPAPPIPRGADFAAEGTPTFITPNEDFYRVDINRVTVPQLTTEDWRLRIHGMVDRERTLRWEDLMAMPSVEHTVTQVCVSNELGGPYISTTNYTGVRVRDILAEVGVRDGANQVFTTSVDGWTAGTPTERVLDRTNDTLLVYAMNRQPLPIEHGFPVRMFVPGLYGYISATKWITDLKLTTFEQDVAYWVESPRNWGRFGPIKTMSRIDSPGSFESVPSDRVVLAGIAWSPPIGIERVEVRVDSGAWMTAELSTVVNPNTWRMWKLAVPGLSTGLHTVQVRATDNSGYTQTPQRVMPIPDGATGWHTIQFTVR